MAFELAEQDAVPGYSILGRVGRIDTESVVHNLCCWKNSYILTADGGQKRFHWRIWGDSNLNQNVKGSM